MAAQERIMRVFSKVQSNHTKKPTTRQQEHNMELLLFQKPLSLLCGCVSIVCHRDSAFISRFTLSTASVPFSPQSTADLLLLFFHRPSLTLDRVQLLPSKCWNGLMTVTYYHILSISNVLEICFNRTVCLIWISAADEMILQRKCLDGMLEKFQRNAKTRLDAKSH